MKPHFRPNSASLTYQVTQDRLQITPYSAHSQTLLHIFCVYIFHQDNNQLETLQNFTMGMFFSSFGKPQWAKSCKKDPESVDPHALPSDEHLVLLINRFFETVGMVTPYISKSVLLYEYHRDNVRGLSRPMRALLNIICAFASSTLSSGDPEIHYHRALALLDEKTLRRSSLELSQLNQVELWITAVCANCNTVQVLLLIGSFQQNNQHSVATWTLHAITVNAPFKLGLHSPVFYRDPLLEGKEFRKRLWHAVVN